MKMSAPRRRRRDEDDMKDQIIEVSKTLGYLVFHDNDPKRNVAGFPDLWILGFGKLLVLELKTDTGTVTREQQKWIAQLKIAGIDVRVYRCAQWRTRDLAKELQDIKRAYKRTASI